MYNLLTIRYITYNVDKETNETIDKLIEKLKDNNLGSIKLSNKNNTMKLQIYHFK